LQYIGTGKTDWDVGYTDGGDFGSYTRHYPAGTYNLFARAAGNSAHTRSADISVASGAATISGAAPFSFGVDGTGWQSYTFSPVRDSAGNLIQITFDGNPATLKVLQVQAGDNMNFFMLMPLNTNVLVSTVTIMNVSPDGAALYNPAGTFSFTAASPTAPVSFPLRSTQTSREAGAKRKSFRQALTAAAASSVASIRRDSSLRAYGRRTAGSFRCLYQA